MAITKEERVLRVIKRQEVDYLPSNIVFADRSRDKELSTAFGLTSEIELDDYLENHLHLTLTLQDKPIFYRDVKEEIDRLNKLSFANPDWGKGLVYDNWGMGIKVGVSSFFVGFHPLQGKSTEENARFMPINVPRGALLAKDIETAVKLWNPPGINKSHNFDDWEKDLKEHSDEFLIWPSGYFDIYERGYTIMGWEEFMLNMASDIKVIEELLDKIIFSKEMFKKIIKPRLKRVWDVFNKAEIPIMLHTCGNVIEFLPDLIEIGLKILEPVQPCMDLYYLKKEFGKDLIFFGGIDTQVLPFISPIETKELVKNTIRILGKGGGLIIGCSQELMNDVPIENIKIIVETIKEERVNVLNL